LIELTIFFEGVFILLEPETKGSKVDGGHDGSPLQEIGHSHTS
jgi:hypothetical protein